jgi:rhodanese-related sulfurtransferase
MFDRLRKMMQETPIPSLTAQEAAARRGKKGVVLVDVREPFEFDDGHIPGALPMPLGTVGARWKELSGHEQVIVVCRSGNRSAHATRQLHELGVKQAVNMTGGMISWASERLPVSR